MLFPARDELPGVLVPVQLARRAAEEGPVLLTPERLRPRVVVLELVVRLDHERRKVPRTVVLLQHLRVRRKVRVRGVESDERPPTWVIERPASEVVELDRLDVRRVDGLDAAGNGFHDRRRTRATPALEVVPVEPDDVRVLPISTADVLPVRERLLRTVPQQRIEPGDRLDWIEEHHDSVASRDANHRVHPPEVRVVRRRQIARSAKRGDALPRRTAGATAVPLGAQEVDPHRVESPRAPVGEKVLDLGQRQVHDERLRGVSHHQERASSAIDEVPAIRARVQRIPGRGRREPVRDRRLSVRGVAGRCSAGADDQHRRRQGDGGQDAPHRSSFLVLGLGTKVTDRSRRNLTGRGRRRSA